MTTSELCLNERFAAVPASIPQARRALTLFAQCAGACEEQVAAVRLASSEALTNAVKHAYWGGEGSVYVTSAVTGDELSVLISDDGQGMRSYGGTRGLGVGLALIACLTDGFTVLKRSSGGTELQMRFGLHARNAPERDHWRGSAFSAKAPV
ncbi:MAG: ATP-binding protein [Actinomycetota bacterium]|nr:ATP-binding protein [Actinomycetota bacterium]